MVFSALALLAVPADAALFMKLDSMSPMSLEGCEKSHIIEIEATISSPPEGLELHNAYMTLGGDRMLDADCTEFGGSVLCSVRMPPTPGCTRDSEYTYSDNSLSVFVSYPDSAGLNTVETLSVNLPEIDVRQGYLNLDGIMEEASNRMSYALEGIGKTVLKMEGAIMNCTQLVTRLMSKTVTISMAYAEKGWVPGTYGHSVGATNYADTFAEKYDLMGGIDEAGGSLIGGVSSITDDVCDVLEARYSIENAAVSLQEISSDMHKCLEASQGVIDSGGHLGSEGDWFASVRDCITQKTGLISSEISKTGLESLIQEAHGRESNMSSSLSVFTKDALNISDVSSIGALKIYCDGKLANGGLCCEMSGYGQQEYSSVADCEMTQSKIIYMPGGCPEGNLTFAIKGPEEPEYHARDIGQFSEDASSASLFHWFGSITSAEGAYSFVLYCDDGDGAYTGSDRLISRTEIDYVRPSCVSASGSENCIGSVSAEDDCMCSYKGSLFFGNGANMKMEETMVEPRANRDYELKASKRFYRDSSDEPRCTMLGASEITLLSEKSCQLYAGDTVQENAIVHTLSPAIKTCSRDGYYAYFLYGNPKVMGTGSNCEEQRVFVNDKGFVHIANLREVTEEELAGFIDFDDLHEMYGNPVSASGISYQDNEEDLSEVYRKIREIYSQYDVGTIQFDNFYFCRGEVLNENCGRVPDEVADSLGHVMMDVMEYYTKTGFMPATKDAQIADNLIVTFYTEAPYSGSGLGVSGITRTIGIAYPIGA